MAAPTLYSHKEGRRRHGVDHPSLARNPVASPTDFNHFVQSGRPAILVLQLLEHGHACCHLHCEPPPPPSTRSLEVFVAPEAEADDRIAIIIFEHRAFSVDLAFSQVARIACAHTPVRGSAAVVNQRNHSKSLHLLKEQAEPTPTVALQEESKIAVTA